MNTLETITWEDTLKEMLGDIRMGIADDVCVYELIRTLRTEAVEHGVKKERERITKMFNETAYLLEKAGYVDYAHPLRVVTKGLLNK